MPRPRKKPEEMAGVTAFTVRLPAETIQRVEAIRSHLQQQAPFAKVTTTDVLRHLISEGSARATEAFEVQEVPSDKKGGE